MVRQGGAQSKLWLDRKTTIRDQAALRRPGSAAALAGGLLAPSAARALHPRASGQSQDSGNTGRSRCKLAMLPGRCGEGADVDTPLLSGVVGCSHLDPRSATSTVIARAPLKTGVPRTLALRALLDPSLAQPDHHGAGTDFLADPNLWEPLPVSGMSRCASGASSPQLAVICGPADHVLCDEGCGSPQSVMWSCAAALHHRRRRELAPPSPHPCPAAGCWPSLWAWCSPPTSPSRPSRASTQATTRRCLPAALPPAG